MLTAKDVISTPLTSEAAFVAGNVDDSILTNDNDLPISDKRRAAVLLVPRPLVGPTAESAMNFSFKMIIRRATSAGISDAVISARHISSESIPRSRNVLATRMMLIAVSSMANAVLRRLSTPSLSDNSLTKMDSSTSNRKDTWWLPSGLVADPGAVSLTDSPR